MRVVLAFADAEQAEWLASVLGGSGLSVVVLPDPDPHTPELRNADLLIADQACAEAIGEAGPVRRLLIAPRGGTVELSAVQAGFRDVLAIPSSAEEVVARVNHVLSG